MDTPQINYLDHVALRVKDVAAAVSWYEKVLGLQPYQFEAWGRFPVLLLAGKTGIALFPQTPSNDLAPAVTLPLGLDHFAFRVDAINFEKAKTHFEALDIPYDFQDHHYYHSIYIKDLDANVVELTKLVVSEKLFE